MLSAVSFGVPLSRSPGASQDGRAASHQIEKAERRGVDLAVRAHRGNKSDGPRHDHAGEKLIRAVREFILEINFHAGKDARGFWGVNAGMTGGGRHGSRGGSPFFYALKSPEALARSEGENTQHVPHSSFTMWTVDWSLQTGDSPGRPVISLSLACQEYP